MTKNLSRKDLGDFEDRTKAVKLSHCGWNRSFMNFYANNPSSISRRVVALGHSIGYVVVLFLLERAMAWLLTRVGFKTLTSEEIIKAFVPVFVTLYGLCYWSIDAVFGRKWLYAANLYNEKNDISDPVYRAYVETNLARDLIDLELWANQTFSEFFRKILLNSVEFCRNEIGVDLSDKLNDDALSKKEAEVIISLYSNHLCTQLHKRRGKNNPFRSQDPKSPSSIGLLKRTK